MPNPSTHANKPRPGLWARLCQAWAALLGRTPTQTVNFQKHESAPVQTALHPQKLINEPQRGIQTYNTHALPAAREQWQRSDWASLANLTLDEMQHHPDRAKLALLAGAGHMQLSNNAHATEFFRQAKAWGVSEALIRRILLANVHAQLARCWDISGNVQAASSNLVEAQQLVSLRGLNKRTIG